VIWICWERVAALTQLQSLHLLQTKATDRGLRELAGWKRLQTLDLAGTGVTDAGLKELAGLKQLRWLDLAGTGVTDAGLHELTGLKRLEFLCLPGQVTDAGIATLQTGLPLATITASRPPYTCRRDVREVAQESRD
jgi:hypothetical protein